ncbi:MAG: glutamine amidotransferase [Chloroflexi bacterium]|nr:glutamine amidotransferase [Chloroflexota bacterium]
MTFTARSSRSSPAPSRVRRSTSYRPIRPCSPCASCCSTRGTCVDSGRTEVAPLRLVHLYPDLMSVYGDRGNVLALVRRAEWRGIRIEVRELSLGNTLDPTDVDLIFFGGGQDQEQAVVSPDFLQQKGAAVCEAVEAGAALLSVCGGYQLLGSSYTTVDGHELQGAGLFQVRSVPGPRRHIGNVLIETRTDGERRTLVGFENHSGRTYLAPGMQPLGRALVGAGNNGEDGTEGSVYRGAIGCYLHGSLLPKNPWLADRLLRDALRHRHGEPVPLAPLDDRLEESAHRTMAARIQSAGGRVKSGAW